MDLGVNGASDDPRADDGRDDDLVLRDAACVWHPATHFDDLAASPVIGIASARGPWLHTVDGERILDAIASWWTSAHGHRPPEVMQAIARQLESLDHVMFAGFTHASAVALAEALLRLAGPRFGRVFFADSGADAVEVALKMAVQCHAQRGAVRRRRFAALAHGYHGETLGALATCGNATYRGPFADLLHDAVFLPTPSFTAHRHGDLATDLGADTEAADDALRLLDAHGDELAALVVEPAVQCAGQMRMPGSGYLARVVRRARELGVLVVADEIAVGLGRTGRAFAHTWHGELPDLACVGKALSGGALPLSAVIVGREIEAAFRGPVAHAFAHSHTFCGNPLATAAGVASLALLERKLADTAVERSIADLDAARQRVAAACPAVVASRQAGCIVAFDLVPVSRRPADGRVGLALRNAALRNGVLLRPLGDTLYWMPPLLLDPEALACLERATVASIHEVLG